jgi:type I restriction enzyme, R subunit
MGRRPGRAGLLSSGQRYTNRSLTTAEIIAELVKLAKEMRGQATRHEQLGLSEAEAAFYDAIDQNQAAVLELGDDTLKRISSTPCGRCGRA